MKKNFCCLLSVMIAFQIVSAQQPTDWDAFSQHVDVSAYQEKKFHFEAAVKVERVDSTAEGEIWARVDKPDKKMGFFYNMMDKPIRSNQWKVYTIDGKIDKGALQLVFGGLFQRNGKFYFDDFKLKIEDQQGEWINIPLPDAGFENDSNSIITAWRFSGVNRGFVKSVQSANAFEGKKCLLVIGNGITSTIRYGDNATAGKYANVNGIRIYFEEYGQGEPLLLLHGNSCSINLFEKQIPALAKKFHVIAVDTRGQGKSSEDGKTYSYDLFADDMNALLDHLHLDNVNILGWSDGGNTGLIMAMKYPAKVKRLVTMGANVFIDKTVVDGWVFDTLSYEKKELANDTSYDGRNRIRLIDLLLTEPRHSFEELKIIKCPVFVIAGENDVIKDGHTKAIAAAIPNSVLLIAPKQTHYFPSENPKVFNAAVIDFFEKE